MEQGELAVACHLKRLSTPQFIFLASDGLFQSFVASCVAETPTRADHLDRRPRWHSPTTHDPRSVRPPPVNQYHHDAVGNHTDSYRPEHALELPAK